VANKKRGHNLLKGEVHRYKKHTGREEKGKSAIPAKKKKWVKRGSFVKRVEENTSLLQRGTQSDQASSGGWKSNHGQKGAGGLRRGEGSGKVVHQAGKERQVSPIEKDRVSFDQKGVTPKKE